MSGYRRFIAYVYEYLNGKKSTNCGFIKVEVRDQQCRMEVHLHCPELAGDIPCKIYGFTRKDGLMNGILLGTCDTEKETIEFLLETEASNMNSSGISLGKMGGIIILTDSGNFFATEWDDQPVRPDNFVETKVTGTISQMRDNPSDKSEESPGQISEQSEEKIHDPALSKQSMDTPENTSGPDIPVKSINTPQAEPSSTASAPSATPHISTDTSSAGNPDTATDSVLFRESFSPFTDGEFTEAWKIHPNDLCHFSRRCNALRNNRFIQYGHYNFGHLLLGQRNDGQYILGVPGGYNQQERFMANMFGFPYFKESSYIELPGARGGYWYTLINAPDVH